MASSALSGFDRGGGAAQQMAPVAAFTPRCPSAAGGRVATAGGWHCAASRSERRPVTARDRAGRPAPFTHSSCERPQTARAFVSTTWSRHSASRPLSAATGTMRSDALRRENQRQAEVGTVRDLDQWEHVSGAREVKGPPRWRINGGPWLEYNEGGPYPRQPRGKCGPSTREMPLSDLLPQCTLTPEAQPPHAGKESDQEGDEALRLSDEMDTNAAATLRIGELQDKLKRNEVAIKAMLELIAKMEKQIDEDRAQDAKRERVLREEQERVRDLTRRLHKTQSTLAILQPKYCDEGHEQDTGTSVRSELMRLREEIKNEQAAAHESREQMSRERKARIVAEARVAELQRFIDTQKS
eukprot:COSAG02_NODE_3650_length_6422_cov_15.219516_6_plen_355_part_00